MRKLDWYFDFVSPFSYLQTQRFAELPDDVEIAFQPVLFAALLKHWGTKGPVEIAGKRRFTYRYVQWYAERRGIRLRMPPAHPFNPLPALRLAVVLGNRRAAVLRIFRFIWQEGGLPDPGASSGAWERLVRELEAQSAVEGAGTQIAAPEVKEALHRRTARAIERGVFGVPTFVVDEELFWGVDATDMLVDYLCAPQAFDTPEMRRVSELPSAAKRGGA